MGGGVVGVDATAARSTEVLGGGWRRESGREEREGRAKGGEGGESERRRGRKGMGGEERREEDDEGKERWTKQDQLVMSW